jgi:hypothetical protein
MFVEHSSSGAMNSSRGAMIPSRGAMIPSRGAMIPSSDAIILPADALNLARHAMNAPRHARNASSHVRADEPYRGIAPKDAEILTRVFRELAESGVAVVVTGHEVPTLLAAADHVTWCFSGTTYELGAPDRASEDERFRREYLGASFARGVT